jgi:1-acyl-sn-glycerol-3-phosphate acyltransferase
VAADGPYADQTPPERWGYWISRRIAQAMFALFFRGRVRGVQRVPRRGGVLLVSNHQSFLDPILATLALPRECSYMARDTLFENSRFRRLIEYYNAFPVKRGTADMRAIKETIRRLKGGFPVVTFPEATRTADGSIAEMRGGVVLLARKTGVPIVPTLIDGAFEAWPRGAKLPRPAPIVVAYDEPFDARAHGDWSDDACIAHVRGRILALRARYGRGDAG